jgi:septum formation protein
MIKTNLPIYLASASPRRKILLEQIGLKFSTLTVNLNEKIYDDENPIKIVKRLALEKLKLAKEKVNNGIIITADTIVVLRKQIIGKPKNKKDAEKILKTLSGKTHFVYTGFALCNLQTGRTVVDYRKSAVTFRALGTKEIQEYVEQGSPLDKAGAYGIQDDFGAVFVKNINGCYYNVVGLPLSDVYIALKGII